MAYIRHYFPGVNIDKMSDEEFAILSEEALWLHEQMLIVKASQTLFAPDKS